jgi:phosphate transport system permease protein
LVAAIRGHQRGFKDGWCTAPMAERDTMTEQDGQANREQSLPSPRIGDESVNVEPGVEKLIEHEQVPPEHSAPVLVGSAQPLAVEPEVEAPPISTALPAHGSSKTRIGDRIFAALAAGASGIVIVIVVLIALFLLLKSIPSIADDKVNFLTSTQWQPSPGDLRFGIANLLWVTVIISLIGLVLAVPVAVGIGLFITQYAPRQLARPVAFVIDLLAAIPSIVYGIWGAFVLTPKLTPVQDAISKIPLPLFDKVHDNGTIFDGGVVLAVMILPIVTAISRDVFERTPRANIEAALALGATKWEMIRMAVLPYGRPGVISGAMLGLGRALGETIAVYLIVSTASPPFRFSIFTGGETFASKIANGASEFNNPKSTGAYIAAGLVLFALTFVVNAAARWIVNRRKDFA